jgi:stage II sporulation protein D
MLARHLLRNNLPQQLARLNSTRLLILSVLTICVGISGWTIASRAMQNWSFPALFSTSPNANYADDGDLRLQKAATAALGERRGTVIVMDPQTGRVRAIINSKLAFEETFHPGSTIKPFTALAALRSHVIEEESRTLCGEKYSHEEFQATCSHPRDLSPLNPIEAIAYSCNYYFGKVGERLAEPSFNSTLNEFGFGKQTGLNVNREAQGRLLRNAWRSESAIGEGDYLQATPIQLINAYAALVNGGYLFTPHISRAAGFVPELQASLAIKDEHRMLIVKGMRGAVRYGTAETATLYSLPLYIFGKTGTATEINGFRTQGWFVGFASPSNDRTDANANNGSEVAPDKVELAVLVFLAKAHGSAHGSESAEVARPIFEAYARSTVERQGDAETHQRRGEELGRLSGDSPRLRVPASPRREVPNPPSSISVHLVRENVTRRMSLEDYVRGIVAAEASMESEPEALKALAVASRTYALKNIGRHAHDGYDFCTTTHCQRYRALNSDARTDISPATIEAVESTRGEVLRDGDNKMVDSYFSASCGGATANIATLWGGSAPIYLRGVPDEYCAGQAHHSWTNVISRTQLLLALRSDSRTDVGDRLLSVIVSRRDASRRAELITVEGDRRLTVRGWDFKIIVGRALGWNYLKSSRFEIARSGSNFIFRGSGFGHGLGLCQEGAHMMAARGANYRQILAKYFPSTIVETQAAMVRSGQTEIGPDSRVTNADGCSAALPSCSAERLRLSVELPRFFMRGSASPRRRSLVEDKGHYYAARQSLSALRGGKVAESFTKPRTFADVFWDNATHSELRSVTDNSRFVPATIWRTLRSEDFRISYPDNISQREIEGLLSFLQSSRRSLIGRAEAAGITVRFPSLEIFINETTGDFVARTGQPAWTAAATKGNRIELQPLETLKRRRVLETTLRHELVHTLIDVLSSGRAPRWLAEGFALHLAGEGHLVARYQPRTRMTTEEIGQKLDAVKSASDMRLAYAAAYSEVRRLIQTESEANVWRQLAQPAQ